jgi:hypothetical protein
LFWLGFYFCSSLPRQKRVVFPLLALPSKAFLFKNKIINYLIEFSFEGNKSPTYTSLDYLNVLLLFLNDSFQRKKPRKRKR